MENIHEGIRRIRRARIFIIIGYICMALGFFCSLVEQRVIGNVTSTEPWVILSVLGVLGAYALLIIGRITDMIGQRRAGQEAAPFRNAFVLTLVVLILSVVGVVLQTSRIGGPAGTILRAAACLLEIAVVFCVFRGIREAGGPEEAETAPKNRVGILVIAVFLLAAAVLELIGVLSGTGSGTLTRPLAFTILPRALLIAAQCVYLGLLKKVQGEAPADGE